MSRDGNNIQYTKGMQGQFLGESINPSGMRMAKIFVQGVTETGPNPGERNKYVPIATIKTGPRRQSDFSLFHIDANALPGSIVGSSPGFGIREVANTSSPLQELNTSSKKALYVRTDSKIWDHVANETVPMAEFRRQPSLTVEYDNEHRLNFAIIRRHKEEDDAPTLIFQMKGPLGEVDGIKYPYNDTICHFIIEARLQGKAIENSWAPLPCIEIFENSEQANSFAVRIEWEHPAGSG